MPGPVHPRTSRRWWMSGWRGSTSLESACPLMVSEIVCVICGAPEKVTRILFGNKG
jgi:hypothetical protein